MAPKREAPALIASLLITLSLLTGGVWWSAGRWPLEHWLSLADWGGTLSPEAVRSRFSQGERVLVEVGLVPEKQAAVGAIAQQQPAAAIPALETALTVNPNDPEARIYLNNARIAQQPSYTIAVVIPAQRDIPGSLEILRGAAQAQDGVNRAGGINGIPVRLVVVNDDNDGAIAPQLATQLIHNPQILGVVGHNTRATILATAPLYQAAGLVAISPLSPVGATATTPVNGAPPVTFRTLPSDFVTGRALAEHLLNHLHQQKAALFYSADSEASRALRNEMLTALSLGGGQVVAEVDLGRSGFSPLDSITRATAQGATALILLPDTAHVDRALQVVQVNAGRLHLLANQVLYSSRTLEIVGPEAVEMVMGVPWHALADVDSVFVQTARQLWGGDVSWRTAMTYDAMQALFAALGRNPTRTGIHQALHDPDFFATGATGTVRFLPSGDRNQGVQLVQVQPGFQSGYGYDFVPLQPSLKRTPNSPMIEAPPLVPPLVPPTAPSPEPPALGHPGFPIPEIESPENAFAEAFGWLPQPVY